ncbi:hypothetical protein [Salirhabdus salicampi]|uniref:hypothetical protein n=1 Tax=Salirhabdus salicampi TaxID=476102 RepID=UPI0020C56126|nr:hypothetical protein [Salirhabdus salicampi]MCP8617294.1 hypothetical protein [Salirhabdus salicampi]
MKTIIIRPLATLLIGFTYLFSQFFQHPIMTILISIFTVLAILAFIPFLNKVPKLLICVLLFVSSILFIKGGSLSAVMNGLNANVGLLCIFIFIPLISIPIHAGKYLQYLETIFHHYIKTSRQLYTYLQMTIVGIGSVMNLGTIPIMYHVTGTPSFKTYEEARLKALNRGFSLSFLWSPYFISIALIISYFNVTWLELFPIGITIAMIGVLLGLLFEGKTNETITIESNEDILSLKKAKKKLLELFSIIMSMTAMTMIIEYYSPFSVITVIPLAAIVVATIWSLVYQSPKAFLTKLFAYTQERLPRMGNELSLFIAAGVFGVAIINAGASDWILSFLNVLGVSHALLLIPLLGVSIVLLSFVGIHPIITITAISVTISSSPLFINDHLIISIGLLSSWMVTVMASPLSATNLMVANLANSNSIKVGLKLNGIYALSLWFIAYGFILCLYFLM